MPPPPTPLAARDDPVPFLFTPSPAPALPPSPTITLAPRDIEERQASIVTVSVTTTGGGPAPTTVSNKFPVAVAVPALVGGMALAFLIGGLWWWLSIKRDKEKKRAWEASQRRKRRRAESAAARKAEMSRRNTAVSAFNANKTPVMSEKEFVPPVPPLPTLAKAQTTQPSVQDQYASAIEEGYNHYAQEGDAPAYDAYGGYSTQPSIEPEYTEVQSTGAPPPLEEKTRKPDRPSRSTARMAAAENAAARDAADPNTRWKPNKPSRFAKEASPVKGSSPYGGMDYDQEETLAENDYKQQGGKGQRQVSGEWGVALGSPSSDGGFSTQSQPLGAHYLNDPYLNQDASNAQRAPSGQYTTDPYASYHDPTTKKTGGGWV